MKASPYQTERLAGSLRITYAWRSPSAYLLLGFALLWNGFIFFFLLAGAGWPVAFHALIGLFLIWYVLALLVNKTVLEASSRELRVHHGPVRTWTRDRSIPVAELQQLYVSRSGTETTGTSSHALWTLKAELKSGDKLTLLNPTRDKDTVRAIEEELESYLGIPHEDREETLELPGLSRLKDILPAGLHRHVEHGRGSAADTRRSIKAPETSRRAGPRKSAVSTPFLFYRSRPGETVCISNKPHELVSNREIDWKDAHHSLAHVLLATGPDEYRQFYVEIVRERWSYYEERPLDQGEREVLGFAGASAHPHNFRNGQDRYYPGDRQQGTFSDGKQAGEELEQYTYLTTRSSTRFRAFRVLGGRWEVSVQEPVDRSIFERCP